MECTLGYFGTFCNESCPPGRFGYRCGGTCSPNCTVEYCNHVNGCHLKTKQTTQMTPERVYSLRTTEVKDRSVEENTQIMQSTSRISLFSEINTKHPFFSRGTPLQKSELNTNYLLAGVGVVIFMVLFMIVIEIRRKSKPPKRKPLLLPKRHENQTCDETFQRPPNGTSNRCVNKTSSKQSNHFSQYTDPVYHEIDESVELMQIPASSDIPTAFGDRNLPKFINNSTRNVPQKDYLNAKTSESHVLPSRKNTPSS